MTTIKHQIKHLNGCVLFEADIPADTPSGLAMRAALEKAVSAGANLTRSYLAGANLAGPPHRGQPHRGQPRQGLPRRGQPRRGLPRRGLPRRGQPRRGQPRRGLPRRGLPPGAYLPGAYLAGANLDGANLVGNRPILQIGPIGSRCAYLVSYITDAGIKVRAGCFFGSIEEFEAACAKTHGDNDHGKEYAAAVAMIRAHAAIWTPRVVA